MLERLLDIVVKVRVHFFPADSTDNLNFLLLKDMLESDNKIQTILKLINSYHFLLFAVYGENEMILGAGGFYMTKTK